MADVADVGISFFDFLFLHFPLLGEVSEWLKEPVSKTGVGFMSIAFLI